MDKQEVNVIELLEYLQDVVDNSPKVPMSGKTMIDRKEFTEIAVEYV